MYKSSVYSDFIFISRYARWIEKEGRRETWPETVRRYINFIRDEAVLKSRPQWGEIDIFNTLDKIEEAILRHDIMPSMRLLMTAGKAAEKENVCAYNCSYLPVDNPKSFDELMYILMCGTGGGFSVEWENVEQLPEIPEEFYETDTTVVFHDSRIGWAKGFREFIGLLLTGYIPKWDVSKLRPKGARLKTMGGRSSGPEPLVDLLKFTINLFKSNKGRKLAPIDCHDLQCKVADIVVVGGVRRSALISLSDLEDYDMSKAKSGKWFETHLHRRLSNNSAVYEEKPSIGQFMKEWISLYESKSGERGIISRKAIKNVIDNANRYRAVSNPENRLRDTNHQFGKNPCSEIILRPYQFCNLTSVNIWPEDTEESIREKIRLATILGTFQSTLTNFKYIDKRWKKNCEDERLLGVSLNGIFDNRITNGRKQDQVFNPSRPLKDILTDLKTCAIDTNREWANLLGINQSTAITTVKPEGTSSALNGTSSGIHPAHSPFYIRNVRNDKKDPLTEFMIDHGFPFEQDAYAPDHQVCFRFPIKSSDDAIYKDSISAIEHLELWKQYQMYWCEHSPSITVSVKEDEWIDIGAWVYSNFEWMSGVAFLPADESNTIYKQAPFTTCTEDEYQELLNSMPKNVDWKELSKYEVEDSTTNQQTLACSGNKDGCLI